LEPASVRRFDVLWELQWSVGLLLSQALTLYTTPVIYIFFDGLGQRFSRFPVALAPR